MSRRRVRFTATAEGHVQREKLWWLENRTHTEVLASELEEAILIMELVEGPTLADRIAQGPIPVEEALPIAKQIAEALEAAHEQGIIHRDLKPANIKLKVRGAPPPRTEGILTARGDPTPARAAGARLERRLSAADVADCTVKVLDFGLAKALEPPPSSPNVSQSPTITTPAMMTGVGVILGTAAYMSPEQARGRPVDKRADCERIPSPTTRPGEPQRLLLTDTSKRPMDWSPDGRFLIYDEASPTSSSDIWVLPLGKQEKPFPYLRTKFIEGQGRLSPDGRWMAYTSDESGKRQVYLQSFPAPGPRFPVSVDGGTHPQWRRDGGEIIYMDLERRLVSVDVERSSASPTLGTPHVLFRTNAPRNLPFDANFYSVSPDAQRFLVATIVEGLESPPITVVVNWTADLKH